MRTYELVMIVRPTLDEEALDAVVGSLKQTVVDNKGEIVRVEPMGRRRLAYQVQKLSEGHYILMYVNLERATIVELERRLKLSDDVIRYMLVRLDEELKPEPAAETAPEETLVAPVTEEEQAAEDSVS